MIKISIADGRDRLGQWDTGRTLAVEGAQTIHFRWDKGTAARADIVDGIVAIPDELLQRPGTLTVYADLGTALQKIVNFAVRPAAKPEDYIYTPAERRTWEELDERITELEENGGGAGSVGPQGPPGPQGPQGPQGPAGSAAEIPQELLDDVNQLKADMAEKKTPYQIAVDNGYTGTEDDFNAALAGLVAMADRLADVATAIDADGNHTYIVL